MNRSWPVQVAVALFLPCLPVAAAEVQLSAPPAVITAAVPDKPVIDNSAYLSYSPAVLPEMLKLMKASRAKYTEGSNLIRIGDSEKARELFDQAVDLVLKSKWDVITTPPLYGFFQDLIKRIQEDESRYLLVQFDTDEDDDVENAFVDDLDNVDLDSIIADPSLREALTADLAKASYDIPISINEKVLKSLNYWLNGGRKCFIDGLQRSGQYRSLIEKVFREESIPQDLMYLAQVESMFRTNALSKAKAKGIWQFEKGTAIRYGLKVTRDVDERSDPEKSTRAAARYLNDLYGMFKDWNLALAAYNWGEGKVQRLIDSTGLNDFWQLVDLKRRLPEETKNHIPLIQASVILGKNPENYGLPAKLDPPLEYTAVSVSKPIDLRAAAKVLSVSLDELKKLNPALRGLSTPANYPNFQLKVPVDTDPDIHERLAALPVAKIKAPPEFDGRHKVKAGETLSGIAARYHVSVSALQKANNISSPKKLIAGKWIQVPSGSTAKAPAAKKTANSSSSTKSSVANKKTAAATAKSSSTQSKSAKTRAKTASAGKKPV